MFCRNPVLEMVLKQSHQQPQYQYDKKKTQYIKIIRNTMNSTSDSNNVYLHTQAALKSCREETFQIQLFANTFIQGNLPVLDLSPITISQSTLVTFRSICIRDNAIISSVYKTASQTFDLDILDCQLEKFQEDGILATLLGAMVLPCLSGNDPPFSLSGHFQNTERHAALTWRGPSKLGLFLRSTGLQDFILFGTRQKARYCWQRRRLLRNWAQILHEYFKWQNPVDSFAEGLRPDLLSVALLVHGSAVRTAGMLCYWPEFSPASALGRESSWCVERTWRGETSPTWLLGG